MLKTWLSPEEMQEVVCRNEGEHDPTICHSHDFCDANMAMHEVFMSHGMDVTDEGGVDRFGQKWGRGLAVREGEALLDMRVTHLSPMPLVFARADVVAADQLPNR